jgi:hypothetical protein
MHGEWIPDLLKNASSGKAMRQTVKVVCEVFVDATHALPISKNRIGCLWHQMVRS